MTTLTGLPGDDDLVPLQQYTLVQSLGGNDTITYDIQQGLFNGTTIDGGTGTDRLILTVASADPQPFAFLVNTTLIGVEELELRNLAARTDGEVQASMTATNAAGINTFIGPTNRAASVGFRMDQVTSFDLSTKTTQGNLTFTIIGDSDAETMIGSSGADLISSGGGNDNISAGAGNDQVLVSNNDASVTAIINGGNDTDTLRLRFSQRVETIDLRDDTIQNFETLRLSIGTVGIGPGQQMSTTRMLASQVQQFSTIQVGLPTSPGDEGPGGADFAVPGAPSTLAQYLIEIDMGTATTLDLSQIQITNNLPLTADLTIKVNGDADAETITGTSFTDIIEGAGGGDTLDGAGGTHDWLSYANSAQGVTVNLQTSSASGGDAAGDTFANFENILRSAQGDTLTGDTKDNTIEGGAGADSLDGGGGTADWLSYSLSAQGVSVNLQTGTGTAGDANGDTLANFENILGSGHGDTLTGDGNANSIIGLAGNDTIAGGAGADSLDGGAGAGDWLSYAGSSQAVNINLATNSATGGDATGDRYTNFENLLGSGNADSLTGDANANVIDSGDGNDTVNAGAGNDTINGTLGSDSIDGGSDVDTVSYAASTEGVFVYLSGTPGNRGGLAQGDTLTNVENLVGSNFRDDLWGDAGSNNIFGGGGRDFVFGLEGADSLFGGADLDFLSGVDGGAADFMDGGTGRDVAYYYTAGESQVVDMSDRADGTKNSGENTADTWMNISGFWGARDHSNTITGDSNGNDLIGGEQGDIINGGGGRDQLLGRNGNDQIFGGADRDLIIAGRGTDTLTGGAGVDTFYILSGDDTNIITDYVEGEDLFYFFRTGVSAYDQLTFTDTGADVQITSVNDTSFTLIIQNAELTDLDQLDANGQAITTFGFA